MNYRHMWTALGLASLSMALIALPGASRQKQEPCTDPKSDCAHEKGLRTQVLNLVSDDDGSASMQVVDDGNDADDNNIVFIGSGGWLGVGGSEVSAAKAKELKLPEERGTILGKVVADSPAAKAGLKENDVVLEINGQRVEGTEQFRRMIREIPAGRTATLTVWRDGHSQNIKVTLGKPEANTMKVFPGGPKGFSFNMPQLPAIPDLSGLDHLRTFTMVSPGQPMLGVDAEGLQGDFGRYFGAPDGEGVLVRGVFPNSPAAKAGLKVGDVITSLNGERIRGISELREKLLTKRDEKSIMLGILRNKSELTLSVELPKQEENEEPVLSERTNI